MRNETTFTITVSGTERIRGFNSHGERWDAAFNANRCWNVGPNGQTQHDNRHSEEVTFTNAMEVIVRRLSRTHGQPQLSRPVNHD